MSYEIKQCHADEWPHLLKEIPDPPKTLFLRGSLPPSEHILLTVVGSRKYSNYGKDVVSELILNLRGYPISIVSGLALGIDALAHQSALEAGLHTLSIPGSGLDDSVLYPRTHARLAHDILKHGGGLLSEFEPTFKATPWSFPQRNRLLAGIAHATLVIEAGLRSGTLITARLATEYNRDVLTIPHSLFSENGAGSHQLMKLGATPIRTHEDILEALHIEHEAKENQSPVSLTPEEEKVMACLDEPQSRDALMHLTQLSPTAFFIALSGLEIKNCIKESGGLIYKRQ